MRPLRFAALVSCVAASLAPFVAFAQTHQRPPEPDAPADAVEKHVEQHDDGAHVWLQGGLRGNLARGGDGVGRFGQAASLGVGVGWRWLDVGLEGRIGAVEFDRTRHLGVGPEIGLRKALGEGGTLRIATSPYFLFAEDGRRGRFGIDGVAQLLFTVHDGPPATRLGGGLRIGHLQSGPYEAGTWFAGLEFVGRFWW
jgi:hypothetical protein